MIYFIFRFIELRHKINRGTNEEEMCKVPHAKMIIYIFFLS